jgi:hypothetical protein
VSCKTLSPIPIDKPTDRSSVFAASIMMLVESVRYNLTSPDIMWQNVDAKLWSMVEINFSVMSGESHSPKPPTYLVRPPDLIHRSSMSSHNTTHLPTSWPQVIHHIADDEERLLAPRGLSESRAGHVGGGQDQAVRHRSKVSGLVPG